MSLENIDTFETQGKQFTSFLSKHQFMHSFIDGNQSESLAKESEITELQQENAEKHHQFLEVAEALKEEMCKLEEMKMKHAKVQERVDDILKDDENMVPGLPGNNSKRQVMEEIIETERVLSVLNGEQKGVNTMLEQRKVKNASLREEISKIGPSVKSRGVLQESISANANTTTVSSSADAKTHVVEEQLRSLEIEKVRLTALMEALHKLTGVVVVSVTRTDEGTTVLSLKVEDSCEAVVSLDSTMSVSELDITRSDAKIDAAKLLCEACILPTPQDLRQVCFVLSASQKAASAIEMDLVALRKRLLVSRLSSHSVQVTFSTGVAAHLVIHECYPEAPNGVQCVALDGFGGWTPQELEGVRRDSHCHSFRRLDDMVRFLDEELA